MTAFTEHLSPSQYLVSSLERLVSVFCCDDVLSVVRPVVVGISWSCVVGQKPGGDARGVLLVSHSCARGVLLLLLVYLTLVLM